VRDGARRLVGQIDADRGLLAGVVYRDPDGAAVHCYNGETATLRLRVLHRRRSTVAWALRDTLVAPGRAHFEYAQRPPVPGQPIVIA